MIGVEADVVEVVVLAAGADAFLRVRGAWRIVGSFFNAKEIRHKRVHAGVREQQPWGLRHQRCGGHDGVLFFAEKIEEALADRGGSHGARL